MSRWPLAAILVAVGLMVWVAASARETVPDAVALEGYRVVYRVEDRPGADAGVHTEVVEVGRPYGGSVTRVVTAGIRSGRVTNRTFLWQLTEDGELLFGVRRPPGGPARDASYRSFVDAAQDGVVEVVGSGGALGRSCTWFAYREPTPRPLTLPTPSNRIETCVDPSGIVLRENWVFDGRTRRVVEAVEVKTGAPPSDAFLEGKDPATEKVKQPQAEVLLKTGVIVAENVEIAALALEFDPPAGWKLDRAALVALGGGEGGTPTQLASKAYVRGNDLVVVERGTSANLSPPWGPGEGAPVAIGERGEGRLVYFSDRVEVRLVADVGYARVIAPSRDIAMRFARGLRVAR